MGISINNIKRWGKMLVGKSIDHVKQGVGRCYSKNSIKGYYNDLTNKVLESNFDLLPITRLDNGEACQVATDVFQYGLGAYDLYLMTKQSVYLTKFKACLSWCIDNQESQGQWYNQYCSDPMQKYSAMTQGEGISLLLRGYIQFGNIEYKEMAKKALEFMLKPVSDGGTADYSASNIVLLEFTNFPPVLNGWIFAIFGLYDYCKIDGNTKYNSVLTNTIETLNRMLPKFDNGYWSKYTTEEMIASPFYHNLHISLLDVMDDLFVGSFAIYRDKFIRYKSNPYCRIKAFILKALQKLGE